MNKGVYDFFFINHKIKPKKMFATELWPEFERSKVRRTPPLFDFIDVTFDKSD